MHVTNPDNLTGGVFPRFWLRVLENKTESLKQGHPVHKEVEWVDLIIAGDKNNKPSMRVTEEHKMRFREEYQAFKDGVEAPLNGTDIREWNSITRSRAEDLVKMGIRTVEDLAGAPDNAIQRIGMGAREIVKKAQLFIGNKDELGETKAQLAQLQKQVAELLAKKTKKKAKKKVVKTE